VIRRQIAADEESRCGTLEKESVPGQLVEVLPAANRQSAGQITEARFQARIPLEGGPQGPGARQRRIGWQEGHNIVASGVDEPAIENLDNGPGAEVRKVAERLAELDMVAGR